MFIQKCLKSDLAPDFAAIAALFFLLCTNVASKDGILLWEITTFSGRVMLDAGVLLSEVQKSGEPKQGWL